MIFISQRLFPAKSKFGKEYLRMKKKVCRTVGLAVLLIAPVKDS